MRLPAALRDEPQFRLLFAGQALSIVGDRITFVVLPFAVLAAGGGLGDVGLVVAAQTVPFALFALFAGVWADRGSRRAIMVISDAVRMACQAAAGVLLITGVAEPWHLALLAFPYGAADAFFAPAMTGLMQQVVSRRNLQGANALRGFVESGSMVLGPAVGGILVATVGAGTALLVDAATFAVSVAFLLGLRPAPVDATDEPEEPGMLAGLRGGLAEVRSRPWIAWFLGALGTYHLVVLPAVFVLGPVLAAREFGGAEAWGVIVAAFGVGSVVGNLLLMRWRPARPIRWAVLLLIGASCQAAILGAPIPVAAIALLEAVTGVCVAGSFVLWDTSLQEHVAPRVISRVSSMDYFLSVGTLSIGTVVAGTVAEAVGLRPTMFAMSVIGVAFAAVCLLSPSVRRLERAPEVSPATAA